MSEGILSLNSRACMVVNQTTDNVHGKAIQPIHTKHYKSIVVTEYSTFYKTIMSYLLMVAKGRQRL